MKKLKLLISALLLSVSSVLSFAAPAFAVANNCTWTGSSSDNFNTAGNWTSCNSTVPQAGDNLVFDVAALSADKTLTNNITSLSVGTITFTGTNSSGYRFTLAGNDLTITGGVVANASAVLNLNITLGGNQTWSGTMGFTVGDRTSPKTLAMGSYDLTLSASYINMDSVLTGSGNLSVSSSLSAETSSPSWTGSTSITGTGSVTMDKVDSLGGASSTITIASGGSLALCGPQGGTVQNPITVGGSGSGFGALSAFAACGHGGGSTGSDPDADVTFTGAITLTANTVVYPAGVLKITGPLSGNFTITPAAGSAGSLVIASSNNTSLTPNGTATAPAETFTVNAGDDQPGTLVNVGNNQTYIIDGVRGDTRVEVGGTLKGTGVVGVLDVFGKVSPGHSPGCLSTGDLTFEAGSAYDFEIGGTTACSEYDQLKTTGTVIIGGGTLNTLLVNGFKPAKGQSYVLISNDGSDAVSGTFTGLAEGATFSVSGYVFQISYHGGDGNDVALTVQNVPAAPDTGFALIKSNPLVSMAAMTIAGVGLLVLAHRFNKQPATRRR